MTCTECGATAAVYLVTNLGRYCRRCWRNRKGDEACEPLAKRCNHCSGFVHSETAPYVKTRDAYYCDEKCQKEERCQAREQRKIQGKPPTKNSKPSSAGATTPLQTASATGGNDKLPSVTRTSPEPTSSKSWPETSKTASFDREGIASALRGSGVDLPPGDCDALETEPGRWLISRTVGRMGGSPTGPRVVAREHGKWRVQKATEIRGNAEFDPVGAWNQ